MDECTFLGLRCRMENNRRAAANNEPNNDDIERHKVNTTRAASSKALNTTHRMPFRTRYRCSAYRVHNSFLCPTESTTRRVPIMKAAITRTADLDHFISGR